MVRRTKKISQLSTEQRLLIVHNPEQMLLKELKQHGVYFAVSPDVVNERSPEQTVSSAISRIFNLSGSALRDGKGLGLLGRLRQAGKAVVSTLVGDQSGANVDFPWATEADEIAIADREDMLSSDQISELLRVTRQTTNRWRETGKLLGFTIAKRGYRYPRAQIGERGQPPKGMNRVIEGFGGDHWAAWRFLASEIPELDGQTGFDAISGGKIDRLLNVIEARAHGSFT